ncbi:MULTISPECIES: sodium:solute symporter family transporter [Hymenobacter]|uniref:Sodium/solute symporter n=2 Tax=Hymenobacter TaxID=89966 RepID=A0ABS6X044_9BACT|nr:MULTISPECIES: sodium/solute symporter [Hymenobacter]MBO3271780.1 sodium/solute symporter [Hymenobacter defluvii]MBW3129211.1 sodium/solute symporter [Hymenobacter profundi]
MQNTFNTLDLSIFLLYIVGIAAYGFYVYKSKQKAQMTTQDYFLAEGSLTWWAIGASMIASNISAEQFIGMSGNGFQVGVAVAAYEWLAAITLIVVAVFFMPIYLKQKIYTMPQFLEQRYNATLSLIMSIFWLFLYVLVNLTSILYLGALAISNLVGGGESFHLIMVALAVFAVIITLGGMKVVGYTDVIQVAVLIVGGLATTYLALTLVSERFGLGHDAVAGFNAMMSDAGDHFHLMFDKPTADTPQVEINKYLMLPGIAMYAAGQWIVNLNYWGCNQYITQRALGADLKTARTGILFAGMLKLLMPVIVMLPGIAAYVLHKNGGLQGEMAPGGNFNADNAYSAILTFLPNGLKGLSLAALTAAIVASLAGKANSISTIFTLDIYKRYLKPEADEKQLVWIGRLTVMAATVMAIGLTWKDLLGIGGEGGFTYIQKYTGFISPGIVAVFVLGMFWKRTTAQAAIAGMLAGFVLSVFFNNYAVSVFGPETILYSAFPNGHGSYEIPFLICMGLSFAFTAALMIGMSLLGPVINPKALHLDRSLFRVSPSIMTLIVITLLMITALYVKFW